MIKKLFYLGGVMSLLAFFWQTISPSQVIGYIVGVAVYGVELFFMLKEQSNGSKDQFKM